MIEQKPSNLSKFQEFEQLIGKGDIRANASSLKAALDSGQISQKECATLTFRLLERGEIIEEHLGRKTEEFMTTSLEDPLTGLLNVRALDSRLNALIDNLDKEGKRRKKVVIIIFIDLDQFKAFNDSRGHEAGNNVLREVAKALKKEEARGGSAFRVGGDEFLFIETLEEDNINVFEGISERILTRINDDLKSSGFSISASLGYDVFRAGNKVTSRELIERADKKMYQHKNASR
jgi:diguanylate cyclase (GGDEF)-like protein